MTKWYELAKTEVGQKEIPGEKDNPLVVQYFRDVGHPEIKDDETAWCAAAVGSWLERSGITSTKNLAARSYLAWGERLEKPVEGCVVILWRNSPSSWEGHVGLFVRENAKYVYLLGGNQKNEVSIAPFPKKQVLGYRWPPSQRAAPMKGANEMFDAALAVVLEVEGGFAEHPKDPGGATNKGITLQEYAQYLGIRLTGPDAVSEVKERLKNISDEHLRDVYHRNYWSLVSAEKLPRGLALFTFDTAVLHGVIRAKKYLQEALEVEVDGIIGPITLGAAHKINQQYVLERFRMIRLRQLKQSSNWKTFGDGWTNRVNAVFEEAKALTKVKSMDKPNEPEPLDAPAPKHWTQSLTIWGTIITFLSTVLPVIGPFFGIHVTPELIALLGEQGAILLKAAGGFIGTAMAILGRFRAAQPIAAAQVKIKI